MGARPSYHPSSIVFSCCSLPDLDLAPDQSHKTQRAAQRLSEVVKYIHKYTITPKNLTRNITSDQKTIGLNAVEPGCQDQSDQIYSQVTSAHHHSQSPKRTDMVSIDSTHMRIVAVGRGSHLATQTVPTLSFLLSKAENIWLDFSFSRFLATRQ